MKKMTPSYSILAAAFVLSVSLFSTSCSTRSVDSVANQLHASPDTEVLGYNGKLAPQHRTFISYGQLPETSRKAMLDYIKTGEWQQFNYATPQTFVRIQDGITGKNDYWSICTDVTGNLAGILPAKDARSLPSVGNYKMIVNKTPRAAGLSYAILKGLQPSDSFRQSIRKNAGLTTPELITPVKVVTPPQKASVMTNTSPSPTVAAPATPATPAPAQPAAEPAPTTEEDPFGMEPTGTPSNEMPAETDAPATDATTESTSDELSF